MAAKGPRENITLECTECKRRNYMTSKNKRNNTDRLELVKYCKFCMLYNGCRCVFNVEEIDEKTGEKRVVARNFKISSLTDENVNMFFLASICKKYVRNQYLVHRIERYYRDLTYWEWKKEE